MRAGAPAGEPCGPRRCTRPRMHDRHLLRSDHPASRSALRQTRSGFLLSSGKVMCRPPRVPPPRPCVHRHSPPAPRQPRSTIASGHLDRAALDAAGDQRRQHLHTTGRSVFAGIRRAISRDPADQEAQMEIHRTARSRRRRRTRLCPAGRREPDVVFLPGFRSDMTGEQGRRARRVLRRTRPGDGALRLFGPRRQRRPIRGRHDRPLGAMTRWR